jgi:signal transduction histidine kinase
MTILPVIITAASSCLLFLLVLINLLRDGWNTQKTFFILSSAVLGVAMLFETLTLAAETPDRALQSLRIFLALGIFSPALTLPFFHFFARDRGEGALRRRMPSIIFFGLLLAVMAVLIPVRTIVGRIHFMENGPFWGFDVTGAGKALAVLGLIINVAILYLAENSYRAATVPSRVKLKYPMLGLIASSVTNFIVMSRIIVLSQTDRHFLAAAACGLVFYSASFLYAGLRYGIFEIRTPAGSAAGASVVTVVVAGFYFLAMALVSYISALAGMSYDRFTLIVLGAFALFGLLAVGISGKARRFLRRFIHENIRSGVYNYRREWRHYARIMAGSSTVDDLLSNTISSLCDTVMVRQGMIWVNVYGGKLESYGLHDRKSEMDASGDLLSLFDGRPVRVLKKDDADSPAADWMSVLVFLGSGDARGFIALGRKDVEEPWNEEDVDFLATIADQLMLTLENLLMEERFLESKQMESFNKFASFVIHDLKNTVGMLSLTAENARDNINDEEFQEDAIDTIERSVQKMHRLIASLNAHKTPAEISRVQTDVSAVIAGQAESLRHIADKRNIEIRIDAREGLTASVDPSAISRIAENLLLNAMEAVSEGGSVGVTAAPANGGIVLTFHDNGPGFDPVYMEEDLFKPFRSTKKNGLGIGLALCRSLAEAHGGEITVRNSGDEGGAVVTVTIPPPAR